MFKIKRILSTVLVFVLMMCCFPAGMTVASAASGKWVGSWGTPAIESGVVVGADSVFSQNGIHLRDYIPANSSIRTVVKTTIGGTKIKLKFSNYYGKQAITINEVTVANTGATDDVVDADSIAQVTFNGGNKSITIAAGSEVCSDEINFTTTALQKISITSYFRNMTPMYVVGLYGGTAYLTSILGNRTHKPDMTSFATKLDFSSNSITYNTIPFLTRVDVYASSNAYCVVICGDSTVTNDVYLMLEQKLQSNGIKNVGFVMSGIIGNGLLYDGVGLLGKVYGQAFVKRFNRDVLSVPGTKYAIIKVGVNDVVHPTCDSMKGVLPYASVDDIIAGYKNIANQAASSGINLYLCTRTPYKGYERNFVGIDDCVWSQTCENMLIQINSWVRGSSTRYGFTGSINLDALRDPFDSTKIRSQMTTDGIHFSYLGQIALSDLIPESAYGVNRNLTDLATTLKINPYNAAETATQGSNTSATGNTGGSQNTTPSTNTTNGTTSGQSSPGTTSGTTPGGSNPITITPGTNGLQSEPTSLIAGAVIAPTTSGSANQIQVNDGGNQAVVTDDTAVAGVNTRAIAGYTVLATAALMMIFVSLALFLRSKGGAGKTGLSRGTFNPTKGKKKA